MLEVKSVNEVFQIIEENFKEIQIEKESISIEECYYRILAEDIYCKENIPHFNRSMVDGYAVNSLDTFGATESTPVQLFKKGAINIGKKSDLKIERGESVYVPTGGEIPEGADAVVMIEWTTDYNDEFIYINKSVPSGADIIFKGDDFKENELLLVSNRLLTNKDIILLASLGIKNILVKKRLNIGIISTGDELISIEEKIRDNKIRDINSYSIFSTFNYNTFKTIRYGIVGDDFSSIKSILTKALLETDIVILSGGSSVGEKDLSLKVINSFNNSKIFCYGIAIKPGKPTLIAKIDNKPVIVLPGHPLSCFMILNFFVVKIVENMLGINTIKQTIEAILTMDYPSNSGRDELIPVNIFYKDKRYFAMPLLNKSGLISPLIKSNGFIHKKREIEILKKDDIVEVNLF
ncbi:MAG TPA: molybdopterin molybdotransferase MoeA [Spirochaetota bacterium]|nr:molybdopterin molybdotransferase MoeA [Spirochaetota bacterium]HOL55998.1 molybdopterin molybdotransferase MoeA [Spirochaetota bacterium]HPP03440.1 molybdopterin molybdotransferase MoeA [Spirochaetota bacterium]